MAEPGDPHWLGVNTIGGETANGAISKDKSNASGTLSGVTPKSVSGLAPNLLLWGTRETSLYRPIQQSEVAGE